MKKKFLGIICFLYVIIIIYLKLSNNLKNYLSPTLQTYTLLTIIPLIIMGLVLCLNNKTTYQFKISDLVLLLPLIMLIIAKDGRLSMTLANNREKSLKKERQEEIVPIEETMLEEEIEDIEKYDFTNPDFDIIDQTYDSLVNYLTYNEKATKFINKTIRIKGFTVNDASFIPNGYFAIGKYSITCCAADATYIGMIAKSSKEIKNNTWYEIEGILTKGKDREGIDILTVKVINIKEIDGSKEEQYVYPCYAYDNGSCKEMQKYNLTD